MLEALPPARDLWDVWMSGESIASSVVLGLRVQWWGRIGKVLQLISAVVALAQLAGPERLRVVANRMHRLRDVLRAARRAVVMSNRARDRAQQGAFAIGYLLLAAVWMAADSTRQRTLTWWAALPSPAHQRVVAVAAAVATSTLLFVAFTRWYLVMYLSLEPLLWLAVWCAERSVAGLARLAANPRFAVVTQVAAFWVFVIGFALDFAAS